MRSRGLEFQSRNVERQTSMSGGKDWGCNSNSFAEIRTWYTGDGRSAGHDTKDGGKERLWIADDNGKLPSTDHMYRSNLIGQDPGTDPTRCDVAPIANGVLNYVLSYVPNHEAKIFSEPSLLRLAS